MPSFHPVVRWSAAVASFVACATTAWLVLDWGGPRATQAVDDVAEIVFPIVAALCCAFAGARGPQPRATRVGWLLLGFSALSWGLGQFEWTVYELVLDVAVPFPSIADVGYLGAIPLAVAGMLALGSRNATRATRVRAFMDALIIATAVFFVSWAIVLGPSVAASEGSWFEQAIAIAYPVGDVIVLSLAFHVALRAPASARRPIIMAAVAIGAMAVADSGFVFLTTTGDYATGNLIDVGWLVGYLVLALAALDRATSAQPTREDALEDRPSMSIALLPYAPFAFALLVGGYRVVMGTADDVILWTGLFTVALVVTRQLLHIADHVRSRRELARLNDELQRLQEFRAQLLNNVSHDLATPLTPVLLQLHILDKSRLDDSHRKALSVIRRNVEQLQRLVTDVKDVARMEAGGLNVELRPVDLASLARSAVESFQDVAAQKRIRLEFDAREGPLLVDGDAGRLTQVVFNFLTNALKFTPEGGRVRVEARLDGPNARVSVTDSGRGLLDSERARLFQPFVQVHDPSEVSEKGTGLGLYINRGIVEQHAGRIGVRSSGRGCGSTFEFDVPIRGAAALLPAARVRA